PSKSAAPRGSETVLVVEDDAHVRAIVRRVLRAQGYDVLEAHGAGAAFEMIEREPGRVQLVVTYLVMPEVAGRSMAAKMPARDPAMKIRYMSGYTEHAAVKGGPPAPGEPSIAKPFAAREMAVAVR